MTSIEFHESMTGSYRLAGSARDGALGLTLRGRASVASLLRAPIEVEGEIDAEGFADHRLARGSIGVDRLREGTLPYALSFTANDGKRYALTGASAVRGATWIESLSVVSGDVVAEGGDRVARCLLRFDVRSSFGRLLKSFRTR